MSFYDNYVRNVILCSILIINRLSAIPVLPIPNTNVVQRVISTINSNPLTDIATNISSASSNLTRLTNDSTSNQLYHNENIDKVKNNNNDINIGASILSDVNTKSRSRIEEHSEIEQSSFNKYDISKVNNQKHNKIGDINNDSNRLMHNDRLKAKQKIRQLLQALREKRPPSGYNLGFNAEVQTTTDSSPDHMQPANGAIYIEKPPPDDYLNYVPDDYNLIKIELEECVLGIAQDYLDWWIHPNGTLRTDIFPRNRGTTIGLDFSYKNLSELALFDSVKTYVEENRIQVVLFMSFAQSGLHRTPRNVLQAYGSTLQYLSLNGNNFQMWYDEKTKSNRSWADFPVLPTLKELDMRNCHIANLQDNMFTNMQNLQKLFLSNNEIVEIQPNVFSSLDHLVHLDLSFNTIRRSARLVDLFSQITEGLHLPETLFRDLTSLVFLDLSFTRLLPISVLAFTDLGSEVKQMSLCYTGLSLIVGDMFKHTSLSVLDISGNPAITNSLRHDSFSGLDNKLTILAFEYATVKSLRWIGVLKEIKMLNLRGNNINQFANDTFDNLENLQILDLSSNHISNWYQPVFTYNTNLQILNLRDNNINLLTTEMMNDFSNVAFLAIGANNFICSCMLRDFIEMAAMNSRKNEIDSSVPNVYLPAEFTTRQFDNYVTTMEEDPNPVKLGRFKSDYKNYMAEDEIDELNIEELIEFEETRRAFIDYDVFNRAYSYYVYNINSSTQNIINTLEKVGSLEHSSGLYDRTDSYEVGDRESRLSLAGDVKALNTPRRATNLDISLSVNFTFQLIDYHENDYNCIDQITSQLLLFADLEICTIDRTNTHFPDVDPESTSRGPSDVVIAMSVLVGLIICGVIVYMIYAIKCSNFRFFWINLRNSTVLSMMHNEKEEILKKKNGENGTETEFMYDVFVSYSETNREWVLDELIPNIEKRSEINICLHERDFQIGLSILENIISCMDRSRVLLLVMSESFLSSHWCQFEMHLAQHRLLETRRDQLILVLLEDIAQKKRPKTLEYLMKTKTYIVWPTIQNCKMEKKKFYSEQMKKKLVNEERNLFWKRLKKAIINSNDWDPEKTKT